MPVHSPGPRLYSSVPFDHLVKHTGAGQTRASNVSLNLTPFVDMMTILVTFLLIVFSASGEIIKSQRGLTLPTAVTKAALQTAPIVMITQNELTLNGKLIAPVENIVADDSSPMIDLLKEPLEAEAKRIKDDVDNGRINDVLKKACEAIASGKRPEFFCPEGLVILQADEGTDARLVNKVIVTMRVSGFNNILFAVKGK
ncbi:MAG: biopolymer transporter ExbD [Myxococcales bacterium]|nr:biopolymer transporter ExbD [Myxococcales bacterium]